MDDGAEMKLKEHREGRGEQGGRWRLGCGDVGLSFSSSVWILVLLLGAGAPLACPGLRYLKYRQTRLVADISTCFLIMLVYKGLSLGLGRLL